MGVCGKIQPQPAAPSPRATRKRATARRRDVRRRGPVRSMCQRFLSKVCSEVLLDAPLGGLAAAPAAVPRAALRPVPLGVPGVQTGVQTEALPEPLSEAVWRGPAGGERSARPPAVPRPAPPPSRPLPLPLHRRTRFARSDPGQVRLAAALAARACHADALEPTRQRRAATTALAAVVEAGVARAARGPAFADGPDVCVRRARRERGRPRGNTGRLRNRPAAGGVGPGATDGCTICASDRPRRAGSEETGAGCPGEAPGRTTRRRA